MTVRFLVDNFAFPNLSLFLYLPTAYRAVAESRKSCPAEELVKHARLDKAGRDISLLEDGRSRPGALLL